jgi:hypothetical protein
MAEHATKGSFIIQKHTMPDACCLLNPPPAPTCPPQTRQPTPRPPTCAPRPTRPGCPCHAQRRSGSVFGLVDSGHNNQMRRAVRQNKQLTQQPARICTLGFKQRHCQVGQACHAALSSSSFMNQSNLPCCASLPHQSKAPCCASLLHQSNVPCYTPLLHHASESSMQRKTV